ncbi:beta-glucosidase [Granulicella aggregans]|uniref:Beta-glucosidase n=1 Tax=Granulicella aggregans TaxID=474949 RepID=A0A7W8E369_9BACT|nr:GH1 family beta-glucosidase [Granulicella aggregans]MBB5057136.1 beta-glucosidase [Granulicella aggregans]
MAPYISRRSFARLLSVAAGALSLPAGAATLDTGTQHAALGAAMGAASMEKKFPTGFLWGSATASYQVEGGVNEGGRGQTIWDTFSHTPGKVANGDTGDVSTDSYHRYREDVALMKALGLRGCRFSVAWSRIFPTGVGQPNQAGLDYYNRVVDELLGSGIQPFCTLFHWDLPQALEDKGGWQNPDTAKAFADYAGYMGGKLSDRVKSFMTMNEIRSFTELGYQNGMHAPGLRVDAQKFAQVNHIAVLGHGLSVQALRASTKPGTKIGLADNAQATCPVLETPEHIKAAEIGMREQNAQYLTVIMEGKYTDAYLKRLGPNAPKFTAEELKIIGSPLDFVGLNVYQPTWVRADSTKEVGYSVVEGPASYPHMLSPWLTIGPEALYWSPKLVSKLWRPKELYITENGCSSSDVLNEEGQVLDTDRVMYLRNYLTQLHRAISEDVPVKGYFLWSLLDNFEWADGYGKRFGITYVDFKTQKRTPKLSSEFYKATIAKNSIA